MLPLIGTEAPARRAVRKTPRYRRASDAAHGLGMFARRHVMVDRDAMAAPHHRTDADVAGVEIGIRHFVAVRVIHALDAETIERIADQFCVCGLVGQAAARSVIMVFAPHRRIPTAQILHLVGDGVAPASWVIPTLALMLWLSIPIWIGLLTVSIIEQAIWYILSGSD